MEQSYAVHPNYKRLNRGINIFPAYFKGVYSLGLLLWIFRGTAAGRASAIKTIIQSHLIVATRELKHETETFNTLGVRCINTRC